MKDNVVKFVEENMEEVELVAEHGSPQMRMIAEGMLLYYYDKKRKKRRKRRYT